MEFPGSFFKTCDSIELSATSPTTTPSAGTRKGEDTDQKIEPNNEDARQSEREQTMDVSDEIRPQRHDVVDTLYIEKIN
jgi:hypothetical protein